MKELDTLIEKREKVKDRNYYWACDDLLEDIIEYNLTQKTTAPKGEVVCPKCKAEKEWRCPNCWAIWLHWCVWKHYPWYSTSISAQWAWCMWCNKYVNIPHQCPITMKYQSS